MGIATTRANLAAYEQSVSRLEGERDSLARLQREAEERRDEATAERERHEKALKVLQGLEEVWRKDFQKGLASVVSQGLTAVFGEKMEVELESSLSRDVASTEIKLTVGEGAQSITSGVLGSTGGSLVNVLSLLLRVLMLVSIRPKLRRVLLLDEPMSMIDEYDLPASVGQLIRNLAERLNLQFVIVTHEHQLVDIADIAYEVKKKDGKAHVRKLNAVRSA